MFLLYWVPKNLLSYWVGKIMHLKFPRPLSAWMIQSFAKIYSINREEAELPLNQYHSIGDFFTRRLKSGVRPIGSSDYIHPADSRMTSRGGVVAQQLIQAKGKTYSIENFLKDTNTDRWQKGYFITYYLCPTDYHRVHSPVNGFIREIRYVPGNLWPVNEWSTQNIQELFLKNERVVIEIETEKGPIAVVLVGATNVGSIRLSFEPTFRTNHSHIRKENKISYVEPLKINKGDELGLFAMGSTVIVVASAGWSELEKTIQVQNSIFVKMGQSPE